MNIIAVLIISAVILSDGSKGQVLQFGECTDVKTMEYFEIDRFLGTWYVIERFPVWYEDNGTCAYKRFLACGRSIEIQHFFVRERIQYVLHVNSTYAPGDDAVFFIEQNNVDPFGIPIAITTTDYSNYAVAYGCKYHENLGIKYITAWILSRNPTLDPQIRVTAALQLNSLPYASVAYLEPVPQDEEVCEFDWTAHVQSTNLDDDGQ